MVGRSGNETSDCDRLYHSRAVVDCYSIMHVCVWNALQQTRMSTVQYTHCKLPHKACLLPYAMTHTILIMYIPKQVGFFLVAFRSLDCFQFRLQYHMERKGWGSTPHSQLLHVYMECGVYGVWCTLKLSIMATMAPPLLAGFTVAKNNILAIYKN